MDITRRGFFSSLVAAILPTTQTKEPENVFKLVTGEVTTTFDLQQVFDIGELQLFPVAPRTNCQIKLSLESPKETVECLLDCPFVDKRWTITKKGGAA